MKLILVTDIVLIFEIRCNGRILLKAKHPGENYFSIINMLFDKFKVNEKLENGYYDLTNGVCRIKRGYNTENIVLNAEKLENNNNQSEKCCYYY